MDANLNASDDVISGNEHSSETYMPKSKTGMSQYIYIF